MTDYFDSTEAWDDHPSLTHLDFTSSSNTQSNHIDPFNESTPYIEQKIASERDDLIQTLTQSQPVPIETMSNKDKLSITLAGSLNLETKENIIQSNGTSEVSNVSLESCSSLTTIDSEIPIINTNISNEVSLNKVSLSDVRSMSFTTDSTSLKHTLIHRKRSVVNLMTSVFLEPMTDPLSIIVPSSIEQKVDIISKDMTDSLFIGSKISKLHIQTNSDIDDKDLIRTLSLLPKESTNAIDISVTEPTHIQDMIGSHTTYRILTKTNLERFKKKDTVVIRRFKDFYFLHQYLVARYPGVIVPAIPQKVVIGRFQDEFIENRRYLE